MSVQFSSVQFSSVQFGSVQFSSVTPPPATMILRCALLLTVVVLPFYYSQGEVELVTQLSGLFVNTLHIIMRKYKYLQW